MKSPIIILLFLFASINVANAQIGGLYQHAEACELMLDRCEQTILKGDTTTALVICREAFDEAMKANDANLITRVKLFELKVYHENEMFTSGLEAALTACKFSEHAFDELKLLTYIRTLRFYEDFDIPEIGTDLVDKALAIKTDDVSLTSYLMSIKVSNLIKVNKNEDAAKALNVWIDFAQEHSMHSDWIKASYSLGILYNEMKIYQNATLAFKEMNTVATWNNDKLLMAVGFNNIGLCQQKSHDFGASEYNFLQALSHCPSNATEFPEILLNYAYFLKETNKPDLALDYAIKAKESSLVNNNNRVYVKANIITASLLHFQQRTNEAITICREMTDLASRFQLEDLKLNALELLALCYASINDRDSERLTISQINSAKSKINELDKMNSDRMNNNLIVVEQIQKNIERFYAAVEQKRLQNEKHKLDILNRNQEKEIMAIEQELIKSEFDRSNAEREKVKRDLELLRVTLDNQQKQNAIVELESNKASQMLHLTQLELDKQGQQNKLLLAEKQNEILQTETVAKEEKLKKENAFKKIGYGIGFLSFLGMILAIFITRKIRSNNKLIQIKNDELKLKNDDIHKSIVSASFFQGAIAADSKALTKKLKDGFVYYAPLDTVSGDLPFVEHINGNTYIAAIDCMGHGVPAAMLSFTAYYNLKQLIEQNGDADVAEILKMMDDQVTASLKSKGEETKFHAGMDISLVKINQKKKILEFAGAKSPLIICKGDSCETIKGSPFSVGDVCPDLNTVFTSHKFEIDPGTRYFLMSDGYCHQLGGTSNQKIFSRKRLTNLLSASHRTNTTELKNKLITELENWKGNSEQTDDVLVIGFQI